MNLLSLRNLVTRKLLLSFSGIIASGIAVTILMAPEAFYAVYGIEVAGNTNLTNELKAPAGMLLVAGLMMLAGVFRSRLTMTSLVTGAAVYLSYGLSRIASIAVDGVPHNGLVEAAVFEIAIGAACLFAVLPDLVATGKTGPSTEEAA